MKKVFKRLIVVVSVVIALLMIPLVAMQFTDEVNWSLFDFGVAAVLLLGVGALLDIMIRNVKNRNLRIALCIAILLLVFLIWAELAVGIFDSPLAGS